MAFELLKQRHSYALGVVVILPLPRAISQVFESGVCVRARGEVFLVTDRM